MEPSMVIGLLTITSIPTITGVAEAISAQKKQNAASKEQEKFHLGGMLPRDDDDDEEEDDTTRGKWKEKAVCVLKDGKAWLNLPEAPVKGHRFCGFHFKYPGEEGHLGLVSTASDDSPMLNWIYVDAETGRLRHGTRKDTLGHVIGPWGWTEDEAFLTLRGARGGFVARKESVDDEDDGAEGGKQGEERWGVYWDPERKLLEAEGEREEDEEDDEDEEERVIPMLLRRRPLLGMASSYVRDEKKD
ncbi:Dolichyl-diphosphooligosaccharide--protein glycosyltransferase subunit 1 [Purpureocillium lavendulum]|uniref:Dolichyl-diphosphooligosaccharide--protein glycosyltransferase subunit 1 n=1 Tax=Purpureocillium lavendulum TaxID=1247861 RepID=A0AB34G3L1_9HYPO|nr:Dolichyl-diphosphooligosaccharide--protein glycosyltransferase subunit 1 [Purpureocillium lavendulum]